MPRVLLLRSSELSFVCAIILQIGSLVNRAGISNLTGLAGETNVQASGAGLLGCCCLALSSTQHVLLGVQQRVAVQLVLPLISLSSVARSVIVPALSDDCPQREH